MSGARGVSLRGLKGAFFNIESLPFFLSSLLSEKKTRRRLEKTILLLVHQIDLQPSFCDVRLTKNVKASSQILFQKHILHLLLKAQEQ